MPSSKFRILNFADTAYGGDKDKGNGDAHSNNDPGKDYHEHPRELGSTYGEIEGKPRLPRVEFRIQSTKYCICSVTRSREGM